MSDGFQPDTFQADTFQSSGAVVTIPVPVGIQHVAGALGRLTEQFKNKTNIAALLSAYVAPSQPIEDALQQLLVYRSISTASGTQLDVIGSLVGQSRGSLVDLDYMRYILARIATNRSSGTIEELYTIARAILNDSTPVLSIAVMTIAAMIVRIHGTAISDSLASILISFLRDAHAGGVKLTLETAADIDANTFTLPIAVFGSTAIVSVSQMTLHTGGWPDVDVLSLPVTGSVLIDQSLATAETIAYTFRGFDAGNVVIKFATTTTQAHADFCSIVLTTSVGLGLGDGADAGQPDLVAYSNVGVTGGRLADARE